MKYGGGDGDGGGGGGGGDGDVKRSGGRAKQQFLYEGSVAIRDRV